MSAESVWYKVVAGFNEYLYVLRCGTKKFSGSMYTCMATVQCGIKLWRDSMFIFMSTVLRCGTKKGTVVFFNLQRLVNLYTIHSVSRSVFNVYFNHQWVALWYKVVLGFSVNLTVLSLSPWKYKKVDSTNIVITKQKEKQMQSI